MKISWDSQFLAAKFTSTSSSPLVFGFVTLLLIGLDLVLSSIICNAYKIFNLWGSDSTEDPDPAKHHNRQAVLPSVNRTFLGRSSPRQVLLLACLLYLALLDCPVEVWVDCQIEVLAPRDPPKRVMGHPECWPGLLHHLRPTYRNKSLQRNGLHLFGMKTKLHGHGFSSPPYCFHTLMIRERDPFIVMDPWFPKQQMVGRLRVDHMKLMGCSDRPHGQVEVSEPKGVDIVTSKTRHFDWMTGDSFFKDADRIHD